MIKYFDSDDSDIEKPKITEVQFREESSSILSEPDKNEVADFNSKNENEVLCIDFCIQILFLDQSIFNDKIIIKLS